MVESRRARRLPMVEHQAVKSRLGTRRPITRALRSIHQFTLFLLLHCLEPEPRNPLELHYSCGRLER
jgi:hypothetical protein